MKITKFHHLATPEELLSGKPDALLQQCIAPLHCQKHDEPFECYCTEPSCLVPLCAVCKTTVHHDGHTTEELPQQAKEEASSIQKLLPNVQRTITSLSTKISNLNKEEKLIAYTRKKLHRDIREQTNKIIEIMTTGFHDHAEKLHQLLETLVVDRHMSLSVQAYGIQDRLQAAKAAVKFAEALLWFNRTEDIMAVKKDVCARLDLFQYSVDPVPTSWGYPSLGSAYPLFREKLSDVLGRVAFEDEPLKNSAFMTFSAKIESDEEQCVLCDVALDGGGNIVVVDKENKKIKVFDLDGKLKMSTAENALQSPDRIAVLRRTRNLLVKDEKRLKLVSNQGKVIGLFTDFQLKQPVGLTESTEGEILVTEWMTGEIVSFDEKGFGCGAFHARVRPLDILQVRKIRTSSFQTGSAMSSRSSIVTVDFFPSTENTGASLVSWITLTEFARTL